MANTNRTTNGYPPKKVEKIHFLPEGAESTACGLNQFQHESILMTQFFNPEVRSVTCKRCINWLRANQTKNKV